MAKKIYNYIVKYIPKSYFILQIIVGLIAGFWLLYNHQPKTGDDVEHLHSAWLVYQGKVPYVDFFQHHNPLLWYLFAPLMGVFAYNIEIFDIVRIISTLVMILTLFISSLIIKRFVTQSWYSAILVICAIFPSYVVFTGQDFRPDNYMVCCYMLGLYWYFAHLDTHKVKYLVLSFISMFLSFMFMQKSVFLLLFFACIVLYHLYNNKIDIKDFAKSTILPLLGCLFFVIWLYYHDMINIYWLSNYIFNLYIPDVYHNRVDPTNVEFYYLTAMAFISSVYLLVKGNICIRVMCLLWFFEVIQRIFYFSLDRHYYYFLLILNGMLVGTFAYYMINKFSWSGILFMTLSIINFVFFYQYCINQKLPPNYHRYVTPKYVLENTNRCDSVLNGYGLTYGIFTKDVTYYWNLNGQLDVIGNKIGLAPLPDLNKAVEENLPKIIYTGAFWDEKLHQQKINSVVHKINPFLRDKYYNQSIFVDIFILKPEYEAKRRCHYDVNTNSWKYYYKE